MTTLTDLPPAPPAPVPAGSSRWPSRPVRLALAAAWALVALVALTPIIRDLNNWMSGTALSGGTSDYGLQEALSVYVLPLLAFGALGLTALVIAGGTARKLVSLWLGLLGAATVVWSVLLVLGGVLDGGLPLTIVGGLGIGLGAATLAVAVGAWGRWGRPARPGRRLLVLPVAALLVGVGALAEVPLRHPLPDQTLASGTDLLDAAAEDFASGEHTFEVVETAPQDGDGRKVVTRLTGSFDSDEETATYERWRPALTPPTAEEIVFLPEGYSQADLSAYEEKTERISIPGEDGSGYPRTWPGESLVSGGPHGLADLPATYARLSADWEELGERTVDGRVLTGHRADVDADRLLHETYLDGVARAEAEGEVSYREKQSANPSHYEDFVTELEETMEVWLDEDGHLVEAQWSTSLEGTSFVTTYRFDA